jgi:organic radical activating enzyme
LNGQVDMNSNQKLKQLLSEKEMLFIEVEKITDDIFEAPVDIINVLLETRGNALEQVNKVDEKLNPLIEDDEHLRNVLNCSCDISGLSGESKELFDQSLRIKAVVNRIIKNQESIRQKIENERDSLLQSIENMNNSSKTVAESYKRSVETALTRGFDGSRNKTV